VTEFGAYQYRVFLTYSAADKVWGEWLQAALEDCRIDKHLVGLETPTGPVPGTLRPIFCDCEHVPGNTRPSARTLAALDASQFLVALCSPNAAKSACINHEIRRFKGKGRADRVIPVLVGDHTGNPECESIPQELCFRLGPDGRLQDPRGHPPAADARLEGDGETRAIEKVVTGLLGLSGEEVARAAVAHRRHVMISRTVAAGLLAFTLACAGLGFARYELARNDALRDRTLAHVSELARKAVAASKAIGLPRSFSLLVVDAAEGLHRDIAGLGHDTTDLRLHKALMLIDFARVHGALADNELNYARASEAGRLLWGLADELPGNPSWQLDLSIAYERLGDLLQAQGRFTEAAADYRAGREIIEDLSADLSSADRQRELFIKMGDMDIARGFLNEALASYDESLAIAWRLAAEEPGNTRWQHGLAQSHAKMGDVLRLQGSFDEALASYAASRAVAEGRVAAHPGDSEGQRGLAAAYFKIGEVLALQERPDEALASYRASNAIARHFDALDPGNPDWQRSLGISHDRIGSMLEARNDFVAALAEYRSALAIAEWFAAADPGNATWQQNLGLAHEQIGDVLQSLGDLVRALKAHEAKRAIVERLAAADSRNVAWQYELGLSRARIGPVLEALGDFAAAAQEYEACLAIAKRIADAERDNAQARRNLALSYGKLAAAHHWLGKSGQALAELRQGREMMAALLETVPGTKSWTEDLARLDSRIAALEGRASVAAMGSPTITPATASWTTISTPGASAVESPQLPAPATDGRQARSRQH
jgi:tetratricopeptide (TPR) repeat protein